MIVSREVILFKEEVTYNVDPIPTNILNAILVENLAWANESPRMNERPAVKASFGKLQHVYGGTLRTATFDVELKGSGVAGDAPEFGDLLEVCGFAETIDSGVSVTYDPASTGIKSGTMYYYQDGTLMSLTGCRGNVTFNLPAGEVGKASFTVTGHVSPVSDDALPVATYDSIVPVPFINAGFDIGGYAAIIATLTFDMANAVAMSPNPNEPDGFGEIRITGRDVAGSFDPEHQLVATSPFDADWRAGTTFVMTTGAIGSVAGNIYTISHPVMYYREIAPGDRDAIRTLDISYGAAESTTDDEISIAFT